MHLIAPRTLQSAGEGTKHVMGKSLMQLAVMFVAFMVSSAAEAQDISYSNLFGRASGLQEASLPKEGRHTCVQAFSVNPYETEAPLQTFAKSIEQAQENLYVLCLKRKCDSLGSEVSAEMQSMQAMSSDQLSAHLQALGLNAEEIKVVAGKLKAAQPSRKPIVSCQSVSVELRVQLANICMATPLSCY